ncbi:hypothetical protein [Streptomyces cadmiisoli]|uniref:hypothetical protein n=1 Tax=Streptomyces cadmiisoli TaxID=2184053 RepID=UPI003D75F24D
MSSAQWGTHGVEMTAERVIKRFASRDDGRAEREWRGLTLLSAHVLGLAPEPWAVDLAADEPVVVMYRVAGDPLRGMVLGRSEVEALAAAVTALFEAVPVRDGFGADREGDRHDLVIVEPGDRAGSAAFRTPPECY